MHLGLLLRLNRTLLNFVTSFQEKADLFNKYFANQCNPIDNGSVLPELHASVNKLSEINVDISQISSIINKLHSKKPMDMMT